MNLSKTLLSIAVVLPLCFASSTPVKAADDTGPVNSRLERLNARNAKIRSRVIRNSKANTDFGFGSRKAGLNVIRQTRSQRNKTIREYKLLIRRPSLRAMHSKPVSRSRTERMKSADKYENRLQRGLSVCSERHRSRYDRNNCIRKFTRGTRTFE
jgi:hypothetical protein